MRRLSQNSSQNNSQNSSQNAWKFKSKGVKIRIKTSQIRVKICQNVGQKAETYLFHAYSAYESACLANIF